MRLKGFPQHWINLVANAVSNCWFSVLVNGEHAGFFHSTRGLRQGDPLSPALFVLAADYLSQGLNRLFVAHPMMYYQSPGRVRVSHLAYADDMMIFTNICRQHMELLRDFLHAYERVSGQRINSAKSSFILSRQVPLSQLQEVQYVMGYQLKYLPVTYLGVPLYKGNRKACLFDSLISRIRDMLQGWAMTNLSHGGRLALVRSVLQAMPLHLLQVIHPPKSVLITIERIFNGFFWGSYNGRRHIHWCSWDKICRPVAEGGLGIRSLAEYVRAFSMKLWWRFRLKSSLWSEYLHDRYCRALHPTHVPYNRNHSSVWHRLCRIRDVAEPLIFWTLGQGAVSFWHDNWFGEKPLAQLVRGAPDTMEPVCYYWHEGEWNVPKIFRIVPPQIAHIICRIPIAAGQRDRIVWTATSNGTFSTASAWEAIRVASPRRQLFTDIWHRSLRPTVSVFLWRLFQDWIPVDERMKRKGFSFASKCQCCEAEESISHLFVEGEVVREVWLHFANVFGLQLCETGDLVNLVHFWRYSTPFHSDLHIRTLVPFLILWSTWTQRNAAKYHGAHFTATGTILEVQRHLRTLYAARIMTSIQWKGDLHRALAMGFCFRPIAPQAPRVVRWSTPSPAWFKLNSDGSSLGNPGPAAAAGIIRDADGQVRLAYQFALGTTTSVVSELTAVWRGLELARAHSLAPIVVEVDATVVLQLLQSRASGIWVVQHLIMRIVQLQQELGSDVRHIFREANGAADHLAKDAASRQLTRVMYQEDITGVLRGIIRLDKMGTPYLRRLEFSLTVKGHWINLVANAVSNCWFSVLVNGEHAGFFHSTRGLRQGDPLSPALFVLAADYLSQGLNRLFVAHPMMYYQSPGRVRVSHLAYADDMMIFTNICRQHMELLRDFLHAYERVSGQRINSAKSSFILSRQLPLSQLQEVQYVMGYQLKYLPVTYLGVPLYKGNRKACLFDSLISRIRDMLQGWAMTNLSHGGRLALIRSVLQAMPLHLLQVIHPPKSVLITIERIFNGFFWSSYNGRRHIHWCSWDKICRPVAEGGLGIRSLAEYVRAFSMKLWWRFRLKSSLWSEYLHDRYCRALHPTHVPYNRNHSSVWHRLCRIRDVAEPLIFWTLGQGAVSFWHDNWFGEKPLAQLVRGAPDTMEPVCYYWHEGEWNVPKIFRIVPPQIAHIICRIPIAAGQRDRIVWTATSNGTFSTASAWEAIRVASPRRQLFTDIWHRSLRPTVSVFLWRLFQDWIPVDERMKRKGFSFASKCQCCEAEESISHLFVEGEVVREVWLHFANVFGLQLCETGDLVNLVHFWRYSTPFHSDLHIRTLVPFLILWSTWTQRNAAKYHGAHFTATGTILEVQRHLRTLYAARIMTSIQWKGDLHRALAMGFCFRPIAPQAPRVVRWSTPSPAWFKLNSDGSSLGNPGPAAAAGIIRDADGQVRLAYQFALGTATSVVSELTAVWRGLELARAHSLAPIVVEVDATVVLQLLQSRASGIWEVQHLIMRIVQLQQELGSDVRHIFREANGAADHLAKDAASRQLTRVMYQEDITGVLRGIIRLDKMGTPYLRRGKAAPPQPPSLGRPHGLGVACVGLVLAARVRRGTPVGRLSGGLRCCVRPMPICIVCAECLPVRNGKPSGACFDCDLLKHGQHKPRPSKGWSVGPLMLVGLPPHKRTDVGAVGIRRSGVLVAACGLRR
ncbi:UNVERIFIED_CONTAM: putative mitochondrial protein [Sesamum indicum]